MDIQIQHHIMANYGDHAGEAITAHAYDPDETVADLVARVMDLPVSRYRSFDPSQFIVLRVIAGTEPKESPGPDPMPF